MNKKILTIKKQDSDDHFTKDILPELTSVFDFKNINIKKKLINHPFVFKFLKPFLFVRNTLLLKKENPDKIIFIEKEIETLFKKPAKFLKINTLTIDDDIFLGESLPPVSIKTKHLDQDNLFLSLAQQKKEEAFNRTFTVGVDCDFDKKNYTDIVLNSLARCVEVDSKIQMIFMGDGEGRKKMIWLAKRLNLEKNTWFVGEQSNKSRWFRSFDFFINTDQEINYKNFKTILEATLFEMPVMAFENNLLEKAITNDSGFLIKKNDDLAQKILFLYKNRLVLSRMGRSGKNNTLNIFNIDNNLEKWKKTL